MGTEPHTRSVKEKKEDSTYPTLGFRPSELGLNELGKLGTTPLKKTSTINQMRAKEKTEMGNNKTSYPLTEERNKGEETYPEPGGR